jgi:hypothetical protein
MKSKFAYLSLHQKIYQLVKTMPVQTRSQAKLNNGHEQTASAPKPKKLTKKPIVFDGFELESITQFCVNRCKFHPEIKGATTNETIVLRRLADDVVFIIKCSVEFDCDNSNGFNCKHVSVLQVERSDEKPVNSKEIWSFMDISTAFFLEHTIGRPFPYDPNRFFEVHEGAKINRYFPRKF